MNGMSFELKYLFEVQQLLKMQCYKKAASLNKNL